MSPGDQIVADLLKINAYLMRKANRRLAPYGINQQQYVVLRHVVVNDALNQKEIASSLLFEKSNLSKIVKKLEGLGLIEKRTSSEDQRMTLLFSTQRGRVLAGTCDALFSEWNSDWLAGLREKQRQQAAVSLHLLRNLIR